LAGIRAQRATTAAGGGGFRLTQTAIGVFLVDQPTHRIAFGSDRGEHKPLLAREGWIMPAGTEGLCQYDAPHEFLMVEIPDRLMAEMGGGAAAFRPVVGALDPVLVELALAAPLLAGQGTLYRETMERALAAQVAAQVAPVVPSVAALDDQRLRRAVAYVQDHLGDDISLDALAQEAAMSAFHFARAFRAALGTSPLQYVIRCRIETAQALLKTTSLAVAEVAHRVGYEDLSRFGQHFKRQVGTTPGAYRAR
jgi:AraC family transcriptional regulator